MIINYKTIKMKKMLRKDAKNKTNIPKSMAFLFVCSNQSRTTSKCLGINLKQCVQGKEINYPIEK